MGEMKKTEWKEFSRGGEVFRIRATYGLHVIGDQEPYLSVTGETEVKRRNGRWSEDSAATPDSL